MNSGFIVAISILTAIFFGSLLVLILVVKRKLRKTFDVFTEYYRADNAIDQTLVDNIEVSCENVSGLELDEVACKIGDVGGNDSWKSNIICLMPHCLGILKSAHLLTDNIVKHALIESRELPETLLDLVPLAKKIGIRVDEVVKSMYPPLDPRLLEARCTALVLSVNNVVLLVKSASICTDPPGWMDQAMLEVEEHLKILREASTTFEKQLPMPEYPQGMKTIEEEDDKLIDVQPHLFTSSSV